MALKYWHGGHTKHRLLYHLVFVPKYRRRIRQGEVAHSLTSLFYEACRVNWWWIEELKIMPDHVHMLIQVQPRESLADVVQRLKGGSSRKLRQQLPDLDEFVWGESFWADGYFAETVGSTSYTHVKRYIKEQQASMPPEERSHGL